MKVKNLKKLIKHILLESDKSSKVNEMIANKDSEPDFFGAVNVEENKITMSDPTHDQMYVYLKSAYGNQEGFNDDAEMAIYWFANFHHGGQSSNLYKVLSNSPFRPGRGARGPEKNTTEEVMYKALEARYGCRVNENEDEDEKLKGKFVDRGEIKLQGGIDYKLAEKIANNHWDIFGSLGKDGNGVYNFKTRGDRFCCAVGMLNGKPAMLSVTTTPGRLQLLVGDELRNIKEQSASGAAGAFSTPMAFRKRKIRESSFIDKIKAKLKNVEEKTTPDGRYIDDMLDGGRMKRADGMPESVEEVSSSGAVFSGGPTIATPGWGTKNKLGSPGAIKATKKLGYKVVKSITTEGEDEYKPVNTAPQDKLLNVKWGNESKGEKPEYGVAKYAHGKWWNYTSSNPHARGRECATPTGWAGEYNLSEKKR